MSRVTTIERVYLAAVGFLAVTVGFWCYFDPAQSANGIPWTLPPLCATFLGSMYLSGAVYAVVCILSRRWGEIELFMPQCALWTGGLAIVSLFYIPAFDFSRNQTQMWWIAYVVYPLVALGLLYMHRQERAADSPEDSYLPGWARLYLRVQGSMMIALGVILLALPKFMQTVWPWQTGVMMLQLYSMPLLAYGMGCWLMTRRRSWVRVRTALLALAVFFGAECFASVRFFALLDGPSFAVGIWLGWLGLSAVACIALSALAVRAGRNADPTRQTVFQPTPERA